MSGDITRISVLTEGITGFRLNAFLALVIVVTLILVLLYLMNRLKDTIPQFLKNTPVAKKPLSICGVIRLDSKRKLVSVAIESRDGQKATAILLIGGSRDICVGWIDESPTQKIVHEGNGVVTKKDEHA